MRYSLIPENAAEEHGLAAHPTTVVLFDPFLPVLQARALMAAVRLGVFTAIGRQSRASEDLAAELSLDADTLQLLLRILVCAGYLQHDNKEETLRVYGEAVIPALTPRAQATS